MKTLIKTLAMLALWATGAVAFAQFPSQPVRVIVPYPAGGGADALARVVAEGLRPLLSQPVIVENRAGASSNIGVAALLASRPDGHTLLLALVSQLNDALNAAVRQPAVVPRLAELGLESMTGTPAQFREQARSESARWGSLIRTLGLRVE